MLNKLMTAGLLLTAGLACAQEFNDSARVVSATPMYEQVNSPRRECWTEYRDVRRPVRNGGSDNNVGGAIVGGVVGGLLGNQIGGGNGKTVATAGGAIAGAILGSQVKTHGDAEPEYRDERRAVERCATRDNWERRLTGYDVRYEYKGQSFHAVMPQDPGPRLPVRVRMDVTPR